MHIIKWRLEPRADRFGSVDCNQWQCFELFDVIRVQRIIYGAVDTRSDPSEYDLTPGWASVSMRAMFSQVLP
jgi:hypothetical protein